MTEANVMPPKAQLSKTYVNHYTGVVNDLLNRAEKAIDEFKARKAERLIERAERLNNHLAFIQS